MYVTQFRFNVWKDNVVTCFKIVIKSSLVSSSGYNKLISASDLSTSDSAMLFSVVDSLLVVAVCSYTSAKRSCDSDKKYNMARSILTQVNPNLVCMQIRNIPGTRL